MLPTKLTESQREHSQPGVTGSCLNPKENAYTQLVPYKEFLMSLSVLVINSCVWPT